MTKPTDLLDALRCCASCRHFQGARAEKYRIGSCTQATGRRGGKAVATWPAALCFRYRVQSPRKTDSTIE